MKNQQLSKKATIGTTMAWIVAAFVIFIMILGYLLINSGIYLSKEISQRSFSALEYSSTSETAAMQAFLSILKTESFGGISILKDIKDKDYDSFKKQVSAGWTEFGKKIGTECYFIQLYDFNGKEENLKFQYAGTKFVSFMNGLDYGEINKKSLDIYVPDEDGEFTIIRFFTGGCLNA